MRKSYKFFVESHVWKSTWETWAENSSFRREVDKNCALLGYYAASNGNSLPTFRDNLSVPSSRIELIGCPKSSERNYHYSLNNSP